MFRFISLFVDFVIWCSETKRFKILFWTCWLKKEKKSWPLTSKSFCGAYTEQKSELLCFSKELLRAFGKIWSRCLPLPAPAGADKRGLGAPFPLVENAGIQPAIRKRVPAGAPAGARSYWKHVTIKYWKYCLPSSTSTTKPSLNLRNTIIKCLK